MDPDDEIPRGSKGDRKESMEVDEEREEKTESQNSNKDTDTDNKNNMEVDEEGSEVKPESRKTDENRNEEKLEDKTFENHQHSKDVREKQKRAIKELDQGLVLPSVTKRATKKRPNRATTDTENKILERCLNKKTENEKWLQRYVKWP
jgi:hypothetical protein